MKSLLLILPCLIWMPDVSSAMCSFSIGSDFGPATTTTVSAQESYPQIRKYIEKKGGNFEAPNFKQGTSNKCSVEMTDLSSNGNYTITLSKFSENDSLLETKSVMVAGEVKLRVPCRTDLKGARYPFTSSTPLAGLSFKDQTNGLHLSIDMDYEYHVSISETDKRGRSINGLTCYWADRYNN